ncbi:HTH_Tnp_Tc3_2 domain-containing protein [Trichonephila clavipes]|nr:HTH_Tnp_Tc3_2 domain-containing protein [Trichonephila clavipes]
MPLLRFRTQYEQMSQFERRRIIGMMEAGWSARPGSGCSRQTNRQKIATSQELQPTPSSAPIQAQVTPSLGAIVSSRIIRRCLSEGHLGSRRPLRVRRLTPTH